MFATKGRLLYRRDTVLLLSHDPSRKAPSIAATMPGYSLVYASSPSLMRLLRSSSAYTFVHADGLHEVG